MSYLKNLHRVVSKIYDQCYNPELSSDEIRSVISEELRRAYQNGYYDGNRQTKIIDKSTKIK